MARLALMLFVVIIGITKAQTSPKCPKNATYKTCASQIRISCSNMFLTRLPSDKRCHWYCECNKGFVFKNTSYSECVTAKQCNPSDILCSEGAAYSPNGWHKICGESTLAVHFGAGCFCSEDLFWDRDRGECVSECPDDFYDEK